MAEDRQVTPEKQLLKLIEESKQSGGKPPAAAAMKRKGLAFLSPDSLKGLLTGRFSFFKRAAKKKMKRAAKRSFSLADLNRLLTLAIAALAAYLVIDLALSASEARRPPTITAGSERAGRYEPEKVSPMLKDAEYYLTKAAARDIFKEVEAPKPKKEEQEKKAEIESVFKDLSLVGISWSANPDIIIEDKRRKKTYFLRRGQVFGDDIKVEAIHKQKVVLSHEGEEFEMR